MNFQYLTEFFAQKFDLNAELNEILISNFKLLQIKKGTHLLYPGDCCRQIYFISSGFFRVYESDGFFEKTTYFATKDHFLSALNSFVKQTVGQTGIVCEEDATIFSLSFNNWARLGKESQDFLLLSQKIMLEYLLLYIQENEIYRTANSAQQHQYLISRFPGIGNIITQKNIASFLGITAPTLSNILKDLLKKPFDKNI